MPNFTIYCPKAQEELYREAKHIAELLGRTISDVIIGDLRVFADANRSRAQEIEKLMNASNAEIEQLRKGEPK